jgi:MerR family copper efflux transcriptional regulator
VGILSRLTIGQLARRVGLRTSTLRYYEEQGLLVPAARTQAGYRLYDPDAEHVLRFIQRAQRLGFSLADIHTLLHGLQSGSLSDESVAALAEERYLTLERRLTELLVLRHELAHLLHELRQARSPVVEPSESLFDRLVDRVCGDAETREMADSVLDWLAHRTGCSLAADDATTWLEPLRGRHTHIWQVEGAYHVLIVGHDPSVKAALEQLAQLEANCEVHPSVQAGEHEEGYLLVARGDAAFIFARLFLALEQE